MKKIITTVAVTLLFATFNLAQIELNHYEVEILDNPNPEKKDTREVNATITFEKTEFVVKSRRKKDKIFKTIKYVDIISAEHSYSTKPAMLNRKTAIILSVITFNPIWLIEIEGVEKHWLTIISQDNFVVLKLENDNYRLIKAELMSRKIKVENIEEK